MITKMDKAQDTRRETESESTIPHEASVSNNTSSSKSKGKSQENNTQIRPELNNDNKPEKSADRMPKDEIESAMEIETGMKISRIC